MISCTLVVFSLSESNLVTTKAIAGFVALIRREYYVHIQLHEVGGVNFSISAVDNQPAALVTSSATVMKYNLVHLVTAIIEK
jgi:hypothetical protein